MKNKKKLIGVGMLAIVVAVMLFVYNGFKEQPVEGAKAVTIEVINAAEESVVYEVHTDAMYLQQVMDEADGLTYVGEEGPYGLMVTEVNGESAIYEEDGAYWGFSVNGEYCNYGIAEQPVEDGDAFQIIYTK